MIHFDDSATDEFLKQWNDSKPYVIAHTSGSTGIPKATRLLKSDMEASAIATCRFFNIDEKSNMVCPLSADYIAGKMMIVRALVSGATLYMEHPSNTPLRADYPHIHLVPIVPSQLPGLIDASKRHSIDNVIIGGAPLSPDAEQTLSGVVFSAYATYGMTETCSHVALRRIAGGNNVYGALPGYTFSVDERSCLKITSSAQSFGSLITNDVVELIDDCHFIWKGRFDNVIISGGLKIHPESVEKAISSLISRNYYISSRNDTKWGQHVVLNIEGPAFDTADLLETMKVKLKSHELPREIIFHDCFRRTSSGKIIRM